MVETHLVLAPLPAEEHDLAVLESVKVEQPGLEVLHLDPLGLEAGHLLLQPSRELGPFHIEPVLEVAVRVVARVDLLAPERGEALQLIVDLPKSDDPRAELRQQLAQFVEVSVGLLDRPQPPRLGERTVGAVPFGVHSRWLNQAVRGIYAFEPAARVR